MKSTEIRKHYGNPCGLGQYHMWLKYKEQTPGYHQGPFQTLTGLYHIAKDANV